jgi:hypothetical protein
MAPREQTFDVGHPSPDRGAVSGREIFVGLFAAPVAWSLQLSANAAVAGLACIGETGSASGATGSGAAATGSGAAALAIAIVNLLAVALALAGLAVSMRSLRRTRGEMVERSGGVMQAGEGRTRFLSVWGVWASGLFLIATGANTIAVFWRGLCPA